MPREPKLNALKMFEAAGRHLNFRLAAEELHLTQGAVAQAVRGLEADLGASLFVRLARGLALTEAGETYHAEISRALQLVNEATRNLQAAPNIVTLSVPPSFASKWLVAQLPYFMEAHPEIEVRTLASDALSDFKTDGVDIAIRQGPMPKDEGLSVTFLTTGNLCAVCGASAPFAGNPVAGLDDLSRLPLIQDAHRYWERLFLKDERDEPKGMLQFNQTALALDAARLGQGVAVAARLLTDADINAGQLIVLWQTPPEERDSFWLIHPKDSRTNSPARKTLAEWLITQLGDGTS